MSETSTRPTDPLTDLADAMESAVRSARRDLGEAAADASRAVPMVESGLSKAAYNIGYGVAFGVVFPAALLARMVPRDNAMVHGLVDGAAAASDFVRELRSGSPGTAGPEQATGSSQSA